MWLNLIMLCENCARGYFYITIDSKKYHFQRFFLARGKALSEMDSPFTLYFIIYPNVLTYFPESIRSARISRINLSLFPDAMCMSDKMRAAMYYFLRCVLRTVIRSCWTFSLAFSQPRTRARAGK